MSIVSIIVVFIFSALFAGFEFALITIDNSDVRDEKEQPGFGEQIFSNLIKNRKEYFVTLLLGSLLLISIWSFHFLKIAESHQFSQSFGAIGSLLVIVLICFIILFIFSILIPNLLFNIKPGIALNILAIPTVIIYFILYPLTLIIFKLSWLFSRLFIRKSADNNSIELIPKASMGIIHDQADSENDTDAEIEHDIKIFQNALDFSKVRLRDCAIPRNEIEAIELNSPVEKLKEKFIETGFSKILVYQDSIDNIIGYAQSVDMFQSPQNIMSLLKNLIIVPETMPANKLLNLFLKEHKSIALVVDEFGGTYGMATIEDIMEEIFGEIEDEHDSTDFKEEQLSATEFIFSGRLEIDYINEKYNIGLPESDNYATIAGFILDYYEEIPAENDKIKIGKFEFDILKLRNPKIELVKLRLLKKS